MKLKLKNNKNTIAISLIAGILSLLLICSMLIQFKTINKSKEQDIEGLRNDELKRQIASYKSRYEETRTQYEENQNKIREYSETIHDTDASTSLIDKEIEESNATLGLTDVEGEGVIITLKDTNEAIYTAEDLRTLVNELKYAGAEAISINENRIINLTDIVTITDSFIVINANARISSPYIVKAIGDKTYLSSTLNTKNSGFVDLMKINYLDISVEQSNNVQIKKYTKDIETKYMKEAE